MRRLQVLSSASFLLTRPLRDVTIICVFYVYYISISTHTPLAGRDIVGTMDPEAMKKFLLTRPLRDVTEKAETVATSQQDFYSHAPCGT